VSALKAAVVEWCNGPLTGLRLMWWRQCPAVITHVTEINAPEQPLLHVNAAQGGFSFGRAVPATLDPWA
jgi:hypothetical protein